MTFNNDNQSGGNTAKPYSKEKVRAYFDMHAPDWDAEMIRSDAIIEKIFDGASVAEGMDILDVACGTGVLFPDYLRRGVASVTAIDLSPEMIRIAAAKKPDARIRLLCGDVETQRFDRLFDCVMVYNAFPHFPDPKRLIGKLAGLLKPDGTLTIAHGMSAEMINNCHKGSAKEVSVGLMPAEELARLMSDALDVELIISDSHMYQVTGRKAVHP